MTPKITAEEVLTQVAKYKSMHYTREEVYQAMHAFASQSNWISVEERLPPLEENFSHISINCICYCDNGEQEIGFYNYHLSVWRTSRKVLFWQPTLPPPIKTNEI